MTKGEAILAILPFEVSTNLITKVFLDAGLDGSSLYEDSDKEDVDLLLAELCKQVLFISSMSEGELSVTYNLDAISSLRAEILARYNVSDGGMNGESRW